MYPKMVFGVVYVFDAYVYPENKKICIHCVRFLNIQKHQEIASVTCIKIPASIIMGKCTRFRFMLPIAYVNYRTDSTAIENQYSGRMISKLDRYRNCDTRNL